VNVLLLGATGSIGSAVRERARDRGHNLVLFARDGAKLDPLAQSERAIVGDVADKKALAGAVEGIDAVVSALGPTENSPDQVALFEAFAHSLVQAMSHAHVRRLIALSGAGCTLPGERKSLGRRIVSAFVRRAVPFVVEAKQRELEVLVRSDLDWTAPRPPRVVERPATGTYRVGPDARAMTITTEDLADFMVAILADGSYVRQAPFVSN
jgi:putative NADH-flavin reductase